MIKKPNIVFILIDDMGYKDLGCYGSSFYETPNIDFLAQEGMRFTDAYASCPVCSPSRASFLSGKYPARVGVTDWIGAHLKGKLEDAPYIDHLPLCEKSLAKTLKENGYSTWHVGKWHLGNEEYYPEKHGFDINIGGSHYGLPYNGYFSPYNLPNLPNGEEGEYLTDRITDEAINLLKNKDEKPFFLFLSHYACHTPIQAPEHLVEKYRKKRIALGLDKTEEIIQGEPFPTCYTKDSFIQRRVVQSSPEYAAMIENLDCNIGRFLKALKKCGQEDNTIVVFTSDNGGLATSESSPTCNLPLCEGKGWMYEGGVREPLIIKWPGKIKAGSVSSEPVITTDFYPTFLEAAELELIPEQHCDGVSLMPLFCGKSLDRKALFWHYPHYGNQGGTPGSSVRMGDYKLIEFFEDGRLELYNLKEDIEENKNIASLNPDIVKAMHNMLIEWRNEVGALYPTVNNEWDI